MAQQSLDGWTTDGGSQQPERCLVHGSWSVGPLPADRGQYRQTDLPNYPRTTVAGLLAAVLGIERDGYYELFAPDESAVAIQPVEEIRTVNMPMNTLSTASGNLQSLNGRGKLSVKLPDPTTLRQQHNYEVLVDPAYRIDIALADDKRYTELKETLAAGKSHYVPSLGLSEHLAEIEYHGEFSVEDGHRRRRSRSQLGSTECGRRYRPGRGNAVSDRRVARVHESR